MSLKIDGSNTHLEVLKEYLCDRIEQSLRVNTSYDKHRLKEGGMVSSPMDGEQAISPKRLVSCGLRARAFVCCDLTILTDDTEDIIPWNGMATGSDLVVQ